MPKAAVPLILAPDSARPTLDSVPELMEKMSLNPARLYRLDCGRMTEGAPADLVIFDPDEEWVVEHFYSKASNSPFKGWKLTGKVKKTICDGRVVYED